MKPLALAAAAAVLVTAAAPAGASACGVERWAVKTLSDGRAARVSFTPHRTSVLRMRRLAPPGVLGPRAAPVETTTWRLRARLLWAKVEEDGDIHLVIADPRKSSATMIAELPSAECTRRASRSARRKMSAARSAFERRYGEPGSSSFMPLTGTATLDGVGFFDFKHGQRGVAPNAIELHPLLRLKFGT